jgi:hypothetical protein
LKVSVAAEVFRLFFEVLFDLFRQNQKRQRPNAPATRARVVSPTAYRLPDLGSTLDAWARVTASGYGEEVMAEMKRRGITPAKYVAGRRN